MPTLLDTHAWIWWVTAIADSRSRRAEPSSGAWPRKPCGSPNLGVGTREEGRRAARARPAGRSSPLRLGRRAAGTPPGGADPSNPGRELSVASALSGRSRRSNHRRDRAAARCRPCHQGPPDPQLSAPQIHLVGMDGNRLVRALRKPVQAGAIAYYLKRGGGGGQPGLVDGRLGRTVGTRRRQRPAILDADRMSVTAV